MLRPRNHRAHALNAFREIHDYNREGFALRLLGDVHLAADRLELAMDNYRQALEFARQADNRLNQAEALARLCADMHRVGDTDGAQEQWQRALEAL